jgi:hypothetical protein
LPADDATIPRGRRAGARSEAKLAATYPAQGVGDFQALIVEILITFILVFVVMAVATDQRAPAAIAPIAVGFALAVGVFIAGPVTGGSVNPARSLGPMLVAGGPYKFLALHTGADHRRGTGCAALRPHHGPYTRAGLGVFTKGYFKLGRR